MKRSKWHESITDERVTEVVERYHDYLDNPGICLACGEEADDCEPDAQRYECKCCGERQVYGAEELLLML